MEFKWLNKNNNENIIVFFNGWGMDEKIISHLNYANYDILVLYDYRSFNIPTFDFGNYSKKIIIAWSMGVFVCNYFYETFNNFDEIIAINGTQYPINDKYGIPEKIYDLTVSNFNELSCKKFMKKISSSLDIQQYCSRSTEQLKEELISIRDLKIEKFLNFNKAYISLKDKIFPSENQKNYWNIKNTPIIEIESMHYIFDLYKNWSDLL